MWKVSNCVPGLLIRTDIYLYILFKATYYAEQGVNIYEAVLQWNKEN